MSTRTVTLKVYCSVCGRALRGYETPDGKLAVGAHLDRNARRCEGRWYRNHQLRTHRPVRAETEPAHGSAAGGVVPAPSPATQLSLTNQKDTP